MVKVNGIRKTFTGWKDPELTYQGIEEAINAGKHLKTNNMKFDIMFTSDLLRAQEPKTDPNTWVNRIHQ